MDGEQGEVEVMHYSSGDYFGEIALLLSEKRRCSVYAKTHCTTLYTIDDSDAIEQHHVFFSNYCIFITKPNSEFQAWFST